MQLRQRTHVSIGIRLARPSEEAVVNTRTAIYLVAAGVVGALIVANWELLNGVVRLNLLLVRAEMPLAVLILLCVGVMLLANLIAFATRAFAWKAEQRKLRSELQSTRDRADIEEESRIQALRTTVEREFGAMRAQLDRLQSQLAPLPGREHLGETTTLAPPEVAVEPELIPPRDLPARRRRH